jgi:cell wall-associated NlpC family hydrolase
MKVSMRIVSLVLTFFVFIGTVAITAGAEEVSRKQGVGFVTASALRLRSGPGTNTKTLDYAYQDEVVVLLGQQGDWYQVSYNLQTGYMHKSYLRTATRENAELGYGRVTVSSVNLRSGPGTGYSVLTRAQQNDRAYIIGINKQWYKVIWNDKLCYIRSDYLDLTEIPYENRGAERTPVFFRGGKTTGLRATVANFKASKNYIFNNDNTPSDLAASIVATAKTCIGVPYQWGGESMSGFDCSGLIQYVFKKNGISLGRTVRKQYEGGSPLSRNELAPGDLVFFKDTYTTGLSHAGIYIGNGQFIHASSDGVMISNLSNSYWNSHYYGACRILT